MAKILRWHIFAIAFFGITLIGYQTPLAFAGANTSDKDGDGYYWDTPGGIDRDPDDNDPCVPDRKANACRNFVLQDLNKVIDDIETLADSGNFDINEGETNSLITKLENAIDKILADKISGAVGTLQAFINQIESFIKSGKIPSADGNAIISEVQQVIDSLK